MNDEFQSASSSILGGTAEGRGFSAEFPKTMWLRMSENLFFVCGCVCGIQSFEDYVLNTKNVCITLFLHTHKRTLNTYDIERGRQ